MVILRNMKLLGDDDWGVIPLDLKSVKIKTVKDKTNKQSFPSSTPSSSSSSISTSFPSFEIRRLTKERSFLQSRYRQFLRSFLLLLFLFLLLLFLDFLFGIFLSVSVSVSFLFSFNDFSSLEFVIYPVLLL
jgi:hypothetical protein